MKRLVFLCLTVLWVTEARLFTNPYPKVEEFHDAGDPGQPVFLTPLIRANQIRDAQSAAFVNDSEILQFAESYAGYLTVNETYDSNLFFWYFKAKVNPESAPLVLWLQGGPGASSLFGLFTENGPFSVSKKLKLVKRQYSWHLNHHLIYIDNPVGRFWTPLIVLNSFVMIYFCTGTGFSFTKNDAGYSTDEVEVGANLYEALVQFLELFP